MLALILASNVLTVAFSGKSLPNAEKPKTHTAKGAQRAGVFNFELPDKVKEKVAELDRFIRRPDSVVLPRNPLVDMTVSAMSAKKNANDTLNHTNAEKTDSTIACNVINARAVGRDVIYTRADSSQYRLTGGTRAWRNNNPGCLRFGKIAREAGAIGSAGGFAVFPSEVHGRNALASLLKTDDYAKLTIAGAIMRYAPPSQNNTARYKKRLQELTGLSLTRRMSELSDVELGKCIDAICAIEGWREGRLIDLPRRDANMLAMANAMSR